MLGATIVKFELFSIIHGDKRMEQLVNQDGFMTWPTSARLQNSHNVNSLSHMLIVRRMGSE